ncbi:28S ribosomal protein S15, mitochondrial [Platysternon megacephalum]|uniref:28S ribosomal protein S15, mitochondrial n=1 Tax=Platysternon megacephalum TaxID=55544 RepID=A0A4D9F7G2_9SAUR|nr:28S ribosomal protein S15, mitochondrial [Platysternon megacephalum]
MICQLSLHACEYCHLLRQIAPTVRPDSCPFKMKFCALYKLESTTFSGQNRPPRGSPSKAVAQVGYYCNTMACPPRLRSLTPELKCPLDYKLIPSYTLRYLPHST